MVLNPVISKLHGKLVVLASASPRRQEILINAGLRFEVVPSWFKETLDKALFKMPSEYAVETAKQKALEVARRMPLNHLKKPDIVIGADTVVTVDGLILEKPVDKKDAYCMLSRLSGKEHSVFTGVVIVLCHEREGNETEHEVVDFYEETKVKFAELSEEILWEYINSGEPIQLGKIYNSSLESPAHKIKCKDVAVCDGPCTSVSCLDEKTVQPDISSFNHSDLVHNVVGPEGTKSNTEDFPHSIVELLDGFKASKTLFTASKLGVFDVLSDSGLTVEEVASRINASLLGTERLLDAAVSLGLLQKLRCDDKSVYRNTEQARHFLVSDSPLSLHAYILHCNDMIWPLFTHLESAVREGTNQHEKALGTKSENVFQDDCFKKEVKMRFMNAMHSIAKMTGRDVAIAFDLSRFRTACDVGGCTGAMAYEFTKAHPELSVIVFDLPEVIEMRSCFQSKEQDSRVSFVAGDFFKDDIPKADLYILARILHDWSDEKVHELLSKISKACTPGCGLLLSEILLDEERTRPSRALLQALSMTEGRQRSAVEYSNLMKKHGFSPVHTQYTENLLDAMLFVKDDQS
ncbi:probable bifunctional dTTP/UTP pyrophosphatase/methyltransferase protein isoform X1 [Neoarius graeffei]|uniref:probable bifunctional dTTP/UTP pyrophosphatase/methyltransferase protein isoform X1 n=1 Tax=Neoarius graeffei TaxID=443677 RepID=UPI00298D3FA9|nr:probable bifunctional dTTP/UTP pyrophosphatase/methyltransferase protein isoform X1 [Neoarius graeffei]